MILSQKVCYSCRKPLIGINSYYCCSLRQLSCFKCSHYICRKCKNQKNVLFNPSGLKVNQVKIPSDHNKDNRCDNCKSNESLTCHKFYQEKKCKKYYCHTCMEIFYSAYKKLLNSFLKDNGVVLQIQVELRCGCDIPQSQIIAYLRKYCIDCSEQITKKSIVLTNNCIIMVECIRKLENQFMGTKFNASKKNQLGQVLRHIKSQIAVCTVCDMKIDGYLRTEWEMIDNMCICSDCLQSSKKKQQLQVSSRKKRNQNYQQSHFKQRIKMSQQEKILYHDQKKEIVCFSFQKQEQNVQKDLKEQREQYDQKMCKLCFSFESTMINRICRHVIMCTDCFIKYQQKKEGKSSLPCPLCQTVGQYIQYITPIFS